jgi:hypothetical protein
MAFNKPDITQLSALGSTTGDVYFPQTKLLLPFDGTNGATTTNDLSNSNKSSTIGGSATISTAQSKFGGSSLNVSSGYCDISSSDIIAFGTDDFTFELWYYKTSATSGTTMLFDCRTGSSGSQYTMSSSFTNETPNWYVYSSTRITSSISTSLNAWHHFAVARSSGTTTMYIDGVSGGSFSDSTSYVSSRVAIGAYRTLATQYSFPGYIDGFRITKGVARYTSAFTPPTTAHSTSTGDVNKQIVVNSTADGVAIGTGGINQARIAKVWCGIDMSTASINDSYSVSSITDNGAGDFTITFTTAMSSADYSWAGGAGESTSTSDNWFGVRTLNTGTDKNTSSVRIACILCTATAVSKRDYHDVNIIVFKK